MNAAFFQLPIKSLKARSFRNWITIFGIVISIAVIFILLTLSDSLQLAVVSLFDDLGTNRIFVLGPDGDPRQLGSKSLTEETVTTIERISAFELVLPRLVVPGQLTTYRNEERYFNIAGFKADQAQDIDEQYKITKDYIDQGRFLQKGDQFVAIIGGNIAQGSEDDQTRFSRDIQIKTSININGYDFKVVGTFKKSGDNFDNLIIIPLDQLRLISNKTTQVSAIDAVVVKSFPLELANERLERRLNQTLGEDNFVIITPDQILRQFTTIIGIVQGVLLAIASISMLVGAVGIANTMFTSVLEREKEIGIMKSIGATNKNIMILFLTESGLIGMIGGIVGVILGIAVSLLIGQIAALAGFPQLVIYLSWVYVLICLAFAFIIGMLSGILPSYFASKKKIVDTLRDQ